MELALRGDYNVIAIQEPTRSKRIYCLGTCNYHVVYGGGRAAIYINK